MIPYQCTVKATVASKDQVTIPIGVRERLGLKTGQVLEFDPTSPFIKAGPVFAKVAFEYRFDGFRGDGVDMYRGTARVTAGQEITYLPGEFSLGDPRAKRWPDRKVEVTLLAPGKAECSPVSSESATPATMNQ